MKIVFLFTTRVAWNRLADLDYVLLASTWIFVTILDLLQDVLLSFGVAIWLSQDFFENFEGKKLPSFIFGSKNVTICALRYTLGAIETKLFNDYLYILLEHNISSC